LQDVVQTVLALPHTCSHRWSWHPKTHTPRRVCTTGDSTNPHTHLHPPYSRRWDTSRSTRMPLATPHLHTYSSSRSSSSRSNSSSRQAACCLVSSCSGRALRRSCQRDAASLAVSGQGWVAPFVCLLSTLFPAPFWCFVFVVLCLLSCDEAAWKL